MYLQLATSSQQPNSPELQSLTFCGMTCAVTAMPGSAIPDQCSVLNVAKMEQCSWHGTHGVGIGLSPLKIQLSSPEPHM